MGKIKSPTLAGASASAAMLPAGASAGAPAALAVVSVGAPVRFHPHDANRASVAGGDSGDQAAAADGYEHGVQVRDLVGELDGEAALPQNGLALVEGMNAERTGFGYPFLRGGQGVGVA